MLDYRKKKTETFVMWLGVFIEKGNQIPEEIADVSLHRGQDVCESHRGKADPTTGPDLI